MEKIISVKRDMEAKKDSLGIGKLKLNISDGNKKLINKVITYMKKKLDEDQATLEKLGTAIEDSLEYSKGISDKLVKSPEDLSLGFGSKLNYQNYYEISLSEKEKLYFDMDGSLPVGKNGVGYSWRHTGNKFRAYDGKRLIACDMLWKRVAPMNDEEFTRNYKEVAEKVKDFMSGVKKYEGLSSVEVLKLYFFTYKLKNYKYRNIAFDEAIFQFIQNAHEDELNIRLMEEYEKAQSGDYAKSFMTKKNITEKVKTAMEGTKFLENGFRYVEFDNETDLSKIEQLEDEWLKIKSHLPKVDSQPELRFRKLGHHKATGLYYPTHDCICLDIRNIQAMIHEYGHMLDYRTEEKALSLSEEFREIILSYRQQADQLDKDSYVSKKKNYYTTPTEVFARGFELYMLSKLETSFMKDANVYSEVDEYKCFNGETIFKLFNFMDKHLAF